MFKYISNIYEDVKIYFYKYNKESTKIYPKMLSEDDENSNHDILFDDKQLRIDILLFVKQFKNTYYKYTNKENFNVELYNSFVDDKNFDGGMTAFDDDDTNVRIFDKYILEYIKNRNDLLTYLQCKNKDVIQKTKIEDLHDIDKSCSKFNVLFAIDMSEKDLFHYCYTIIQRTGNLSMIKGVIFSMLIKYEREIVKIKLNAFTKQKNSHPYLILERFLM